MLQLTPAGLIEVRELTERAAQLARGGQRQRKEADTVLARVAAIRQAGISSDEARQNYANAIAKEMGLPEVSYSDSAKEQRHCEHVFRHFLSGIGESELRDMAAGSATINWSAGPAGGFSVPQSFHDKVILGAKQLTPLLDEEIVTRINTPTGNPYPVPEWDLTSISATRVVESSLQSPGVVPVAGQTILNAFTYRTDPIAASFEIEQDSFQSILDLLSQAFAVGLARGVGQVLQTGTGLTEPRGLLANAHDSGMVTASASAITVDEIERVYFAVNPAHRCQPKAAWILSDKQWQAIRKTAPTASRPLLLTSEKMSLMGHPVYLDLNLSDTLAGSKFIFGNLERFLVRVGGGIRVRRNMQSKYVESGQALYTSLMRIDSALYQPGSDRPVAFGKFNG